MIVRVFTVLVPVVSVVVVAVAPQAGSEPASRKSTQRAPHRVRRILSKTASGRVFQGKIKTVFPDIVFSFSCCQGLPASRDLSAKRATQRPLTWFGARSVLCSGILEGKRRSTAGIPRSAQRSLQPGR